MACGFVIGALGHVRHVTCLTARSSMHQQTHGSIACHPKQRLLFGPYPLLAALMSHVITYYMKRLKDSKHTGANPPQFIPEAIWTLSYREHKPVLGDVCLCNNGIT